MRKIQTLLIAFMVTLSGCHNEPQALSPAEELKHERQKRIEAEAARDHEAASKGGLEVVVFITGIGAILLLITGTILGSRARHHANRRP